MKGTNFRWHIYDKLYFSMAYKEFDLNEAARTQLCSWTLQAYYGRVWLHVIFSAHDFRKENLVRMKY